MPKINLLFLIMSLFFTGQELFAQHKPFLENIYDYIENPQMIGLGQEEGHVPLLPYATVEKALTRLPENSSGYLSLNGKWKFLYAINPEGINKSFFRNDFNEKGMREILVPGHWQMQGYGEKIFRNVAQPFVSYPPKVPRDYNPVGSYRKTFNLPASFRNKEIMLHFEGVSSAFFLWVNGQEAGYNQGANEPAEFNVTKLLKPGKNTISVMVFQYSDGTYNEDQDMWRLGGIHRSVYLMAVPKTHICDYYYSTDLDNQYRDATLNLQTTLRNYSAVAKSNLLVKVTLYDPTAQNVLRTITSAPFTLEANDQTSHRFRAKINDPLLWSAEKPVLYPVTFELVDAAGKTIEALSDRVGIRKMEVKNQVFYLNGVPIKLNGVNSHMQHPDQGHAMDRATILKDFTLMKQFNINCVRTSHYPPVKEYLELADEMGIYIVDECGDEAHATEYISQDSLWTKSYVERAEKMVLRDRNHACVILWSAGNESGSGFNICEVIKAGKRLDPSRPAWMYGGNGYDAPGRNPVQCEDIIGPRYGTPFELKTDFGQSPAEIDPRPSFMDEYLAATGNSLGGLDEYWEVIYRYPRLMGGAIWDFVSPGLREKYRSSPDSSGNNLDAALMGLTSLVPGKSGKAVQLTGTDTWVELYQDPGLDISGKALTLSLWVKPGSWNGNGTFLSKGFYQFGIEQINEKEIEFYVGDRKKTAVKAPLPGNWDGNWHLVSGIYNGRELQLYLDGQLKASLPCTLIIENKPFPVNIGRNPEIEAQENPHHYSNATFDQVAIFNHAINAADLLNPSPQTKKAAICWLDFDTELTGQEYFSMGVGGRTYGTIWPDRTPQPEMWQVKKSAQPVSVEWFDRVNHEIEIWNRMHFSNTSELEAVWILQEEGKTIQEGKLETTVPALGKERYIVPIRPFDQQPGKEYYLLVGFRLKEDKSWAPAGFEVAWDQLPFPVLPEPQSSIINPEPAPTVQEQPEVIRVMGNGFTYSFSKKTGNLNSVWYQGHDFLKKEMSLNIWRAPLANDVDQWTVWKSGLSRTPGMGNGQSNAWFALGLNQMTTQLDHYEWSVLNAQVVLTIESHTCNPARTTCFDNRYVYTISGNGTMTIDHTVTPQGKMPEWLPRVGVQLVLDSSLQQLEWYGRGPFETYPDRKTGAKTGVWSVPVKDQYVPYLIPQENGNHTDVRWMTLQNSAGKGIRISASEFFQFSALPVESDNLSRAWYSFQLKPFDGITLNLDYALSGVGCTAISVLPQYRVYPSERKFRLVIEPIAK